MSETPANADETLEFLLESVFDDIELTPQEASRLRTYLSERHEHLHGPHCAVFVLGSYRPPYKWRLEIAADELNSRHDTYAYLLAPQRDPDVNESELLPERETDEFPELKAKYYVHAVYADYIAMVFEHSEGGALVEVGRNTVQPLRDRTHVFPRKWNAPAPDSVSNVTDVRRLAIHAVYDSQNRAELRERLESAVERASSEAGLSIEVADLLQEVEQEFGDGEFPRYSGDQRDEFLHYERLDRCFPWITQDDLRERVGEIPRN